MEVPQSARKTFFRNETVRTKNLEMFNFITLETVG